METWSIIIGLLGTFGIGTLFANIIDRILNYRLEKNKFIFENIYIERAKVIKETYQKIALMHRAFQSLMAPMQLAGEPSKAEKTKKAVDLANDFIDYFDVNRIFFDENLEIKLNNFNEKMLSVWRKFQFATAEELGRQDIKVWMEVWTEMKEEIPKLKKEIETKFREEIGIKNN